MWLLGTLDGEEWGRTGPLERSLGSKNCKNKIRSGVYSATRTRNSEDVAGNAAGRQVEATWRS